MHKADRGMQFVHTNRLVHRSAPVALSRASCVERAGCTRRTALTLLMSLVAACSGARGKGSQPEDIPPGSQSAAELGSVPAHAAAPTQVPAAAPAPAPAPAPTSTAVATPTQVTPAQAQAAAPSVPARGAAPPVLGKPRPSDGEASDDKTQGGSQSKPYAGIEDECDPGEVQSAAGTKKPTVKPHVPGDKASPRLKRAVVKRFGKECRVERLCGKLVGVDCDAASDGPYYYVTKKLKIVAKCGGFCMDGDCTNCPPKAWKCAVY